MFLYFNHKKVGEVFHEMLVNFQLEKIDKNTFIDLIGSLLLFIIKQKRYYDAPHKYKERGRDKNG